MILQQEHTIAFINDAINNNLNKIYKTEEKVSNNEEKINNHKEINIKED